MKGLGLGWLLAIGISLRLRRICLIELLSRIPESMELVLGFTGKMGCCAFDANAAVTVLRTASHSRCLRGSNLIYE